MNSEEKLSYYITKSKIFESKNFDKKISIAVLSSFTLNGLIETLKVKCAEQNVQCSGFNSNYNQYAQDILDKKSYLYQFSPDLTFLILDTRHILGSLFYSPYSLTTSQRKEFVENKANELLNLVNTFVKTSQSKLVISNFIIPTYSQFGISDNKMEFGIKEMVQSLNQTIANRVIKEPSVYIHDFNGFVTRYGENNTFDYRQYFYGDIQLSFNYIPMLAHDLMGYIKPLLGLNRKCIVLDLDNTLWGGIIGEDGFNGIKLGDDSIGRSYIEFQKRLLSLHERGIILAINSKNNFEDAMKVLQEHPNMILRENHFACIRINWNDKVSNMNEIAEELNIGTDSMVFFDDDPVNREYVKTSLPQILTVDLPSDPSTFANILTNMNDFNVLQITDEDRKRGTMYLQQRKRTELEKTSSNLDEFLKQLNIEVKIKKANEFTIPRISQLTLKTNQFNLTTRRYQEEEIREFANDARKIVGCAQVVDKFGDNGITGVFIINKDNDIEWTLDTFLLSCRVMGRAVEDGILHYIVQEAKKAGVKKLRGIFIPTKKNKPSENFLPNFGFIKEGDYWIYSLENNPKELPHLTLIAE